MVNRIQNGPCRETNVGIIVPRVGLSMSVACNPIDVVLRAIDAAMLIAARVELRLMKRIESKNSSANQRFRALVELATLSRQITIMLTDSAFELPTE